MAALASFPTTGGAFFLLLVFVLSCHSPISKRVVPYVEKLLPFVGVFCFRSELFGEEDGEANQIIVVVFFSICICIGFLRGTFSTSFG